MTNQVISHVVESTCFAAAIVVLVSALRRQQATIRYRLLLLAVFKFALPLSLFIQLGHDLRGLVGDDTVLLLPAQWIPSTFTPVKSATLASPLETGWQIATAIWIAGALALFGAGIYRICRYRVETTDALDAEIQTVRRLQRRLRMRRSIQVRSTNWEMAPSLYGIFSPMILLPCRLSETLNEGELEAVLLHELFHAKRHDTLASVFVRAVTCLFWFHPLLWWLERQLNIERELSCDEAVIEFGIAASDYTSGIMRVCRFLVADAQPGICSINTFNLKQRMEFIMSYSANKLPKHPLRPLLYLLAAGATFAPITIGFLQTPVLQGQTDRVAASVEQSVACVYRSESYLEGSVIQAAPQTFQQQCVRDNAGKPMWIRTTDDARSRSSKVVYIPKQPEVPAITCEPKASPDSKHCACRNGTFSLGANVKSAQGKLTCIAGEWRLKTSSESASPK